MIQLVNLRIVKLMLLLPKTILIMFGIEIEKE